MGCVLTTTTVYMIYVPYLEEDAARGNYKAMECWPAEPKKIGMINNCNFYMPIYDFYDISNAEMRLTTQHLGTVPGPVPEADAERAWRDHVGRAIEAALRTDLRSEKVRLPHDIACILDHLTRTPGHPIRAVWEDGSSAL